MPARRALAGAFLAAVMTAPQPAAAQAETAEAAPLTTARPPDVANGRRIIADRRRGMCLLCHTGPFPEVRFHGTLAPSLAGAGGRWSVGALRYRLIDSRRLNTETIMPAYFRSEGLARVGRNGQGKTLLSAEEIEDVVAFLATLRE